ncbi:hypothetical protein JVU11DRAFT_11456 [Chiua virens]|nr:hypothetical protein JVU11DRAFT_11456 [Chiua virens]
MSESVQLDLSSLFVRRLLAVGGQSLLLYDYFLTFPHELDHVWHAKWSTVKAVFLVNRYGILVGQFLYTLQEVNLFVSSSDKFCLYFGWFTALFGVFSGETIQVLVILRAWPIWGCTRPVAITLISTYIVYFTICASFTFYTMAMASVHDPALLVVEGTSVCAPRGTLNAWIVPCVGLLLDVFASLMVAYPLVKIFRRTQQFRHSLIYRVLARDAFLFFFTSILSSVMTIVSQSVFVNDPLSQISLAFFHPLSAVVGQRVVLNLRKLRSQSSSESIINSTLERHIGVTR